MLQISIIFFTVVGYIVGLGDRHVQNILIDTNSAELIHIDLGKFGPNHAHSGGLFLKNPLFPLAGVAFEQGKTLPTPETVPFRLTRDLVDGMGVAGVEGVFRQCCEKTMVLMRTYQEELRTILEVGVGVGTVYKKLESD
jgi:ataxia telangiectasia mutated family protein